VKEDTMFIRVPGSTSNLGAGFDSIGLAINRYLDLEVFESDEWRFQFDSPLLEGVPDDETNLIYTTASALAGTAGKSLPPCTVRVETELPLARGIGSSAAAIVAGIELADHLLGLHLTKPEKLAFAGNIEGHYDNVAPSLYGGLCVTTGGENPQCVSTAVSAVDMVAIIPSFELKTKKARSILPEELPFSEAVKGSAVANVLITSILLGDWERAGEMMARDVFHQPYRLPLVPEFEKVSKFAAESGAYGTALSGAGPAMICFTASGHGEKLRTGLQQRFSDYHCVVVHSDEKGVQTIIKTPSREML
jgi:homoserine kinase